MSGSLSDVQRIVLVGDQWRVAAHLTLCFDGQDGKARGAVAFLNRLREQGWPTPAGAKGGTAPDLQASLGFTRNGLKKVGVPDYLLALFALKAPAFAEGATRRAATELAMTGENAPERWDDCFAHASLHAVLSFHARDPETLRRTVSEALVLAGEYSVHCKPLAVAEALEPPPGETGQWVHFGYRDGLARVGIKGWMSRIASETRDRSGSTHETGMFVLGHKPDSGGDPWVSGPGLRVWPDETRAFFRNGSFGVLQQIEQRVEAFDTYVRQAATAHDVGVDEIKALLCGRTPDGRPLASDDPAPNLDPRADFNYEKDPDGQRCPFGSHVRRMNPRVPRAIEKQGQPDERALERYPAHFSRARPLLRRGMPYGNPWEEGKPDDGSRGLMGHFFCASIEDQYEHLLGQWADRVPLGSPDRGGARDPFVGAHAVDDGPYLFERIDGITESMPGMIPFTRTRGVAYLFYPSLTTLGGYVPPPPAGIAANSLWLPEDQDDT